MPRPLHRLGIRLHPRHHTHHRLPLHHALRQEPAQEPLHWLALVLQDPAMDGLTPEEWAAVAALLVYQGKGETEPGLVPMPTPRLGRVAEAAERIEERLRTDEAQARLEPTPRTDPGLVAPMHR